MSQINEKNWVLHKIKERGGKADHGFLTRSVMSKFSMLKVDALWVITDLLMDKKIKFKVIGKGMEISRGAMSIDQIKESTFELQKELEA